MNTENLHLRTENWFYQFLVFSSRFPVNASVSIWEGATRLPAMPDMHHVAILYDVVFAFQTQYAFGARIGFGTGFEQLVPADSFCTNEVLFQVGVDGTRRFHRAGADRNGPGAAFVFASGEE